MAEPQGWIAVQHVSSDRVADAMRLIRSTPGARGTVPSAKLADAGGWGLVSLALADAAHATTWARDLSLVLGGSVLAFVDDGARWSYGLFRGGVQVANVGAIAGNAPSTSGGLARAGADLTATAFGAIPQRPWGEADHRAFTNALGFRPIALGEGTWTRIGGPGSIAAAPAAPSPAAGRESLDRIAAGRTLVLAIVGAFALMTFLSLAAAHTAGEPRTGLSGFGRALLTGWMLLRLYQGRPWARWLLGLLALAGGGLALATGGAALVMAMGVTYTAGGALLLFSPQVRAFLDRQRSIHRT